MTTGSATLYIGTPPSKHTSNEESKRTRKNRAATKPSNKQPNNHTTKLANTPANYERASIHTTTTGTNQIMLHISRHKRATHVAQQNSQGNTVILTRAPPTQATELARYHCDIDKGGPPTQATELSR